MGRLIGLDYGLKRIGVAISDPSKIIASPHTTVETRRRLKETVPSLLQALQDLDIEGFVVGMPYRLDGSMGVMADEIEQFAALLETAQPQPVVRWDERLTTLQAERSLREGGLSRKQRAGVVDKVSAAILLQSYLDAHSERQ